MDVFHTFREIPFHSTTPTEVDDGFDLLLFFFLLITREWLARVRAALNYSAHSAFFFLPLFLHVSCEERRLHATEDYIPCRWLGAVLPWLGSSQSC